MNEEKNDLREIKFHLQSHTLKNESEDWNYFLFRV
jgi:hypothetical protein